MDAKLMSKFSSYNEELQISSVEDNEIYAVREKMKDYIPSLEDEYLDKFVVVKSKLLYVGTDEKELEIANRLGIGGGGEGSDAGATVKEIQSIVEGVVELKDSFENQLPTNDTDKLDSLENNNSNKGIIGTRLFDRSDLNLVNGTWNILIEYDRENKETARYGTGYYWLQKGKEYTIGEETLNFKNDYIIDYKNKEFTVLSGRAVNWNVNATLGVNDNIALNLDPMSLANGEWKDNSLEENFDDFIVKNSDGSEVNTGIQRTGDVKYDSNNKSLNFNEENEISDSNYGYLKLKKDNLDFLNGFTFEIYGNLDTLNGGNIGFFSRRPTINSDYTRAMRFHIIYGDGIGRFGPYSEVCYPESKGKFGKIYTRNDGFIHADSDFYQIKENTDFYMTVVFRNSNDINADEFMKTKDCYKYEYYIDGELIDYTYYGKEGYREGLKTWNNDDCPFFIGICCWAGNSNNFFYYGKMYSVRLYQGSITPDEVKQNYDMTLKYRDSFKNE